MAKRKELPYGRGEEGSGEAERMPISKPSSSKEGPRLLEPGSGVTIPPLDLDDEPEEHAVPSSLLRALAKLLQRRTGRSPKLLRSGSEPEPAPPCSLEEPPRPEMRGADVVDVTFSEVLELPSLQPKEAEEITEEERLPPQPEPVPQPEPAPIAAQQPRWLLRLAAIFIALLVVWFYFEEPAEEDVQQRPAGAIEVGAEKLHHGTVDAVFAGIASVDGGAECTNLINTGSARLVVCERGREVDVKVMIAEGEFPKVSSLAAAPHGRLRFAVPGLSGEGTHNVQSPLALVHGFSWGGGQLEVRLPSPDVTINVTQVGREVHLRFR